MNKARNLEASVWNVGLTKGGWFEEEFDTWITCLRKGCHTNLYEISIINSVHGIEYVLSVVFAGIRLQSDEYYHQCTK